MNRPRLFLSAVSEELRSARQAVAATVRTLGFDPVSQDDFPTGYGELRQWLREQLDSCEGLIQLVGQGYGAEPPEVDPVYGRVSYTQFEFLYARKHGKKTWVIVIGKDCRRDQPPDQLDLPRDPNHPAAAGYQAERRALQQNYLAKLKQDNHLRHTANNDAELQNIVLRLRDDLGELRQRAERRERRLTKAVIATLLGLVLLGGGGWWGYQQLQIGVQQVGVVDTEKIRAHLLQTTEETHRRELAEAEIATGWKQRQQLRDAADNAHRLLLSRIEELAASFVEIEGRGTSTNVFQELTRIAKEQGVDDAIAYMGPQRSPILQTVRARAATARERNRTDLQPLLQTAALHQIKGQASETRTLYTDILSAEPDWPEALHAFFWFLTGQGDLARLRTTLADTKRNYEEAHRIAQRLATTDPGNLQWQYALGQSYIKLGYVAMAQGDHGEAAQAYEEAFKIAKAQTAHDPGNALWQFALSMSYIYHGDVAMAQGNHGEAAQAYVEAFKITKTLTARDPGNEQWRQYAGVYYEFIMSEPHADAVLKWQYVLALSYDKLGDVAWAQGKLEDAAWAYGEGLATTKTLLESDPTKAWWQRGLGVFYEKLGNVARAQGKLEEAARAYRDGLAIAKSLAAGDPGNTQWQRDLSVSYDRLGDVAVAQGKLEEAAQAYRDGLAIAKSLATSDPGNTEWQRDLWVSYWRLADLAERRKRTSEARTYWKQAFEVLAGIDKRGLHLSPEDRQVLEILRQKSGVDAG